MGKHLVTVRTLSLVVIIITSVVSLSLGGRIITNVNRITASIYRKTGQEFQSLVPLPIKSWMQIVLNPSQDLGLKIQV